MMRVQSVLAAALALPVGASAQAVTEVPVRMEGGRLIVQVDDAAGRSYDFILGIGDASISTSMAGHFADAELSLGGIAFTIADHARVPDDSFAHEGDARPVGVLGGAVLMNYDVLIDAPGGRMLIKPSGRSVRWPGESLSNAVSIQTLHGYLVRVNVQIGETVADGLLDLTAPHVQLSPPVGDAEGVTDGAVDSFRMGYSGWPSVPVKVGLTPTVSAWGGDQRAFAVVGAAAAIDCALAISWRHQEIRTCIR
jgi:hypothetical protein